MEGEGDSKVSDFLVEEDWRGGEFDGVKGSPGDVERVEGVEVG